MRKTSELDHRDQSHLLVLAILISLFIGGCAHAYNATPARAVDLSGYWKLNASASDDAEAMLQARLEEERERRERWLRRAREQSDLGLPPIEAGIDDAPDAERHAPATGQAPSSRRNRRDEPLRRMLGETQTLDITQSGSRLLIVSDTQSRRLEAGSRSQVSMPEGELADSQVGWDGEWFVIERRVRRGPRVVEKYRLLKSTGQLEYHIAWSGDHLLAGMKVRRVFDPAVKREAPPDPSLGPVR
jgi:hypothetical protein